MSLDPDIPDGDIVRSLISFCAFLYASSVSLLWRGRNSWMLVILCYVTLDTKSSLSTYQAIVERHNASDAGTGTPKGNVLDGLLGYEVCALLKPQWTT